MGRVALTIAAEMGNRLSEEMKEQFRNMVQTGVTVPSLSHYVKYVAALPSIYCVLRACKGWSDFGLDS